MDKILQWGVENIKVARTSDGFRVLRFDVGDYHNVYIAPLDTKHLYHIYSQGECHITVFSCSEIIASFYLFFGSRVTD